MVMPTATASAKSLVKKLLLHSSFTYAAVRNLNRSQKLKQKQKAELLLKRRTRSERELDEEGFSKQHGNDNSAHVPVMLGEVLDVFASGTPQIVRRLYTRRRWEIWITKFRILGEHEHFAFMFNICLRLVE